MVKYKREHFATQQAFDKFRKRCAKSKIKWLHNREAKDMKHRMFRILRQRLYSRYYYKCDERITFVEYLKKYYGVDDLHALPLERLEGIARKIAK